MKMILSLHKPTLFLKTFTLLFFVSISFSKEGLVDPKIISEDLNSISSRNSITLAKLADLEKRINSLNEKLALDQSNPIPDNEIIDTSESDELIPTPEPEVKISDFESEDEETKQPSLPEPTSSPADFNYYFSFIFDINFPSNSKLKTSNGTANLDSDSGFGFKTEIGRRFDWVKLGLGLEYEKHDLSNMRIRAFSFGGKGENSSYKLVLKPGVIFDFNDFISMTGGIDLGLVSRHSKYSVPISSGSFLYAGDNLSFIWGVGFALSANLNDRHSISLGYAFSDFPEADNFSDLVIHYLEAGYSLSF
jgi:opacity protein-like surface antigen